MTYRKINEDVRFKIFCSRNEYYILKLYIKLLMAKDSMPPIYHETNLCILNTIECIRAILKSCICISRWTPSMWQQLTKTYITYMSKRHLFIRDVDFFMSIEILLSRYCSYRIIQQRMLKQWFRKTFVTHVTKSKSELQTR